MQDFAQATSADERAVADLRAVRASLRARHRTSAMNPLLGAEQAVLGSVLVDLGLSLFASRGQGKMPEPEILRPVAAPGCL